MTVLRSRPFVVSPVVLAATVEEGGADGRDLSAVASPPADTQPPSVTALSPWEQARQAWLRFESRVPVQLELVP